MKNQEPRIKGLEESLFAKSEDYFLSLDEQFASKS